MLFHEKLDFLMNVTNTSNSSLAKYSALDSSYISRLRRGERRLPKESTFLESMASYFSKQCNDEMKRNAVLQAMGISKGSSQSTECIQKYILQWLTQTGDVKKTTSIANLLTKLSTIETVAPPPSQNKGNEYVVFYGPDGKRQAAITLLNMLLQSPSSGDLLLYSDENPQWLMNNSSFSNTWTELITKIVNKGNQVKIIHKVSRDINEMLNVIHQWLPLYMTGNVEPYYYPNLRDGVYKRTLYVAPGLAAITSSSIGDNTEGAANMLMTEKSIVDSFTNEFFNYLSLCKPLLMIHGMAESMEVLCRSQSYNTNYITQSDTPYFNTMPSALHKRLLKRVGLDAQSLSQAQYMSSLVLFENKLSSFKVSNVFRLPDVDALRAGLVPICMSKSIYGETLYYSVREFREHLTNILRLLDAYPNYRVYLEDASENTGTVLCIAENYGLLLNQINIDTILEITEPNMLLAFSHYAVSSRDVLALYDREETIAKINEYLENLTD